MTGEPYPDPYQDRIFPDFRRAHFWDVTEQFEIRPDIKEYLRESKRIAELSDAAEAYASVLLIARLVKLKKDPENDKYPPPKPGSIELDEEESLWAFGYPLLRRLVSTAREVLCNRAVLRQLLDGQKISDATLVLLGEHFAREHGINGDVSAAIAALVLLIVAKSVSHHFCADRKSIDKKVTKQRAKARKSRIKRLNKPSEK